MRNMFKFVFKHSGVWAISSVLACNDASTASPTATPDAGSGIVEVACQLSADAAAPESSPRIGCTADFVALSAAAADADLPSARSGKVVLDTVDGNKLYFQNSQSYAIHYDFVSTHLSGNGLPIVPPLSEFNSSEYYRPERRFVLGAVTYYADPKVWALEIAPYDTASAAMIQSLYDAVKAASFFGPQLAFHPTSEAVAATAKQLPSSIPIKTTADLYAGTSYQPLTLGTTIGRLHFTTAANLAQEYLPYSDIVVLDEAPNDITVVRGLITQEFQTPLSHVNVLSRNRGTPNMGLRGAMDNAQLRALDGKRVKLVVAATEWTVAEATQAEEEAFWAEHRPTPVTLPALDLTIKDLRNIEDVTPETGTDLRSAIKASVNAFGGKAAHYSILAKTKDVPIPKAFAVPVFYYDQFMRQNGLFDRIDALLADASFVGDAAVRDQKLAEFREAMQNAPLDESFQAQLKAKLAAEYPNTRMRFRTSTNSEDLEGFPCAGCYESHTGDPVQWSDVQDAIRETWASIWLFRTFEERNFYGVDHKSVGMALLVHHSFPAEEANGVAITNNPYDLAGLEPAFFVNVQWGGDAEVVHPPAGIFSDQFLYFFDNPNQPVSYLSHSNLVEDGQMVLSTRQIHELGVALSAIHERFSPAYGPASGNSGWYAMDVEFKFDDLGDGQPAQLFVKQARPYPRPRAD